ncbi:MAG: endo-1,4-beta-xylanase [Mariniphaga sp.]|nr:endo-1,4-beta-xylanase [Mariniphaga sp.]
MKNNKFFLILFLASLLINLTNAQDEIFDLTPAEKVSEEQIEKRIEEIRMGDLIIHTQPGATVKIEQTRHEFLFGTAIPDELAESAPRSFNEEDRKKYLQVLEQNFNYAVHENALKWYSNEKVQGQIDYSIADRIWEQCNERNIPMRGHCVYWAKDEFMNNWLFPLNNAQLRKAVVDRGISLTNHFKGRINEFDLNNEMLHGDFFRRRLGFGVINEMAWIVKATNPEAKLYLNDYGILDMGFNSGPYIKQINNLLDNGVPIDGIGCQGHLSMRTTMTTPSEKVQRNLDQLAEFNLPIKITEVLFAYEDEQVQVDELNKLMPIYFAHPNVEAVIMWGFWAGSHWQPHCAMWKEDWTPRLQVDAYRDLVFNKWWTQLEKKANQNGELKERAFYGDYKITCNGVTKNIKLLKEKGSAEVNF